MKITKKQRLIATICISFSFFAAELAVGFYTHSIALIADAFHYLSDLIGIVVALVALMLQEHTKPAPQGYTYGWHRATILGAFFNGVFLLALGISILLQAVERFVHLTPMRQPFLIMIVGCVGLALNILVLSFLHEHDHEHGHQGHRRHSHDDRQQNQETTGPLTNEATSESMTGLARIPMNHHNHRHKTMSVKSPGRDLGMLGVFIHVLGDAINNIGVIIAAVLVWQLKGEGRYYADPAVGVFISLMILLSAIPLLKKSGAILLQTAPKGVNPEDVKNDIEMIPGIKSVHELHIWRLDQRKFVASAHIVVDSRTVQGFADKARIIMECLHAYGVHSATLQPEVLEASPVIMPDSGPGSQGQATSIDANHSVCRNQRSRGGEQECQVICGSSYGGLRCCAPVHPE
ncbi:related to zinc/cadmium resistance protein [Fusarium fujikuroi IMI 58289]|uniref:Related to zinc/cadmium resistance protein n=1 Tax=Gibberella fujikuroi (strain CBS 195.34 / IMI 58289 / NRRL A-6831) TaxID=1279085 RepID=S0DNU0_GIBF5|nr:related to zinc/cadmium resistance protein [Fusarium fujikuroi IMI 58289]CCT64085.1 related to zinc/cadmium resistance protein [Fusarium fujikuroi IMI 58289]SCN99776.1 related to zinc/cadmium resistance protein [Fusarium fujikuroi]SCO38101.1 related to zinc/cadmium resistance protein [Fusarium fujikuroi]